MPRRAGWDHLVRALYEGDGDREHFSLYNQGEVRYKYPRTGR